MSYTRPAKTGANIPGDWWDSTFEKRLRISVTNSSGSDLYDHIVTYTVPGGTTVDANSLRVVEHTALGGVDRTWDWRYGSASGGGNRLFTLPAYLSGGIITFKTLGRWQSGETRRFNIYWSAVNGQSAPSFTHLDMIAPGWTATAVAGTAGDVYALVVGGTTYSYTMVGGDTATTIATALKNLINAGTVATATSSAGVVTIKTTTPRTTLFTIANTGTTVTGNLAVVKPAFALVGRIGPDTEVTGTLATGVFQLGLPYSNNSTTVNRLALGRAGVTEFLRFLHYRVNGDATDYGAIDATQTAISVSGPTVTVSGNITCSTRSSGVDWSGTYTAVYQNKICALAKTDNTGPNTLNKQCDIVRLTLTYTCQRAHAPQTGSSSGTAFVNYDVLSLEDIDNSFSGNTTIAGGNAITNYYKTASGSLTSFAANADLSAVAVNGTIMGSAGNTHAMGMLINSVTLSGFATNQPSATLKWFASGNPFPYLQIVGLTNSATIPVGATISIDLWYAHATTNNGTTAGDSMVPSELVSVLSNVGYSPTPTLLATETFDASTLTQTMLKASTRAVNGISYFQAHALANTTVATAYCYQYNVQTGAVSLPDDDDGSYGEAFKLHGLCLRYLRTKDPTLIPLIKKQVQYHLDIEAAAVALYGAYWYGSASYWYWVSATSSGSTYTNEGGVTSGATNLVDPAMPGGVKGAITYTQGQPRRLTSIDQMHMVAHGLYAYLYLLRNESAITADTTLRTNALNYLNRMKTFEADKFTADSCVIDNLYALCSGGTPTHNNGITTSFLNTATPTSIAASYRGDEFTQWEDSNTDNQIMNASANSTTDYYFRAVYAPNSTAAGVANFLAGRVMDFLTVDLGQHTNTTTTASWGIVGSYPHGWNTRVAATGNNRRYNAGRTGDLHYNEIGSGGSRDHLSGRAAQRMIGLAFLALINPNAIIPIEMNGTTTVRSVPILTALDDLARNISLYQVEPTTYAQRFSVAGYLGVPSLGSSQTIDSAYTGYWQMASELWLLVQKAITGSFAPSSYYAFSPISTGTATKLQYGQQPYGTTANTALPQQPVVYAVDANGYLDRTFTGNVTLVIKSGTGTGGAAITGTVTVACVNGVATFSGLSINTAGTGYVLTASASGVTSVDSAAFTMS